MVEESRQEDENIYETAKQMCAMNEKEE